MDEINEHRPEAEWAVVQLMGQKTIAGKVLPVNRWGVSMLLVTVPAVYDTPPFDRFFSHGAVYSITPCDESVARMVAQALLIQPVSDRYFAEKE